MKYTAHYLYPVSGIDNRQNNRNNNIPQVTEN